MRELPGDFEAKKATYIMIGAEYNVPPELVINGDETAVLLVNRAKVTRNTVGAKRVRILGMVKTRLRSRRLSSSPKLVMSSRIR